MTRTLLGGTKVVSCTEKMAEIGAKTKVVELGRQDPKCKCYYL